MTERELVDWILATCRLFGASEATALGVALVFVEGARAEGLLPQRASGGRQ